MSKPTLLGHLLMGAMLIVIVASAIGFQYNVYAGMP